MESHAIQLKNKKALQTLSRFTLSRCQGQVLFELIAAIPVLLAFIVSLAYLNALNYQAVEKYQLFKNLEAEQEP